MAESKGSEKIVCRTPSPGKKPTRIDKWKFDTIRRAILRAVPKRGDGIAFRDLTGLVKGQLSIDEQKRIGSVMWYTTTIKLELEVRGELKRVDGVTPQRLLRS